jgi:pyruvate formate lyase activating enzyme
MMHAASFFTESEKGKFRCELCPHQCALSEGQTGLCHVRSIHDGIPVSANYGKITSLAMDPIEKKPLYHFYPGRMILSIGSLGCNFRCQHCQNEEISQCTRSYEGDLEVTAEQVLIDNALQMQKPMIAFTYNEPIVSFEFVEDLARKGNPEDILFAMISNGYINPSPLQRLMKYIDAFNIDLKAFTNDFYKAVTGGTLKPVLRTLESIKKSGKHLEITYLVIPGLNDDPDEFSRMIEFLVKELGKSQVLHISRYFPRFQMDLPPTPLKTIIELQSVAKSHLEYVYPGNIGPELDSNTYCPSCQRLLIERAGYQSRITGLRNGKCINCDTEINVVYE